MNISFFTLKNLLFFFQGCYEYCDGYIMSKSLPCVFKILKEWMMLSQEAKIVRLKGKIIFPLPSYLTVTLKQSSLALGHICISNLNIVILTYFWKPGHSY